ncbi:MAG: Polar-differentiation response regulator DivK [Chloroflexi bacterium ADurb.Bin360]|nr:MAG: Polar-differentiation response regulator DivK [Chloroflexi bacterium ADurb.Bin360]
MRGKPKQPWDAVILIVEDNFNNFLLMTRLMAFLGVKKCEWKASGWKVLEFAETLGEIDLILMDLMLPDADGFESLESLRSHPQIKNVPIVAVTANIAQPFVERARQVGFDGFIGKPLDPDRFPEQIRRVLAGEEVWEPE